MATAEHQPAARFCMHCGRERMAGAQFCVGCGFAFVDAGASAEPLPVAGEALPGDAYPIRFRLPSPQRQPGATNAIRLILAFPFTVGPLLAVAVAVALALFSADAAPAGWLSLALLVLSLPVLLIWLATALLSLAVATAAWPVALLLGRVPAPLHRLQAALLRYFTRTSVYLCMGSGRWPPFPWQGAGGSLDVAIDPPAPRSRLRTLLVLPLSMPAAITAMLFGVVVWMLGVGAWFAVLATGRLPDTIQEMLELSIGFQCRASAYFPLLLTDRYPWYESGPLMLPSRRTGSPG